MRKTRDSWFGPIPMRLCMISMFFYFAASQSAKVLCFAPALSKMLTNLSLPSTVAAESLVF